MNRSIIHRAAVLVALLATAAFAQAQTQTPEVKAITPKGESANQYPVGLPEGQRTGEQSRSDVKAGARQAPVVGGAPMSRAAPKGTIPSELPPGQTSSVPMTNTQSADTKSMNRSEKKEEGRVQAKKSLADQASPGTSPPNYKQ